MQVVLDSTDVGRLPVSSEPGVLGGRLVFEGTRVPVDALWNNLADGASLEEFLEWFPTVSREQAEEVLRFGYRTMAMAV